MAANYTANYNLCQWEATDQVQRTDFNQDNAKIDAALGDLATVAAGTISLAHTVCDLAMKDAIATGQYGFRRGLILEDFHDDYNVHDITGDLVVQDGCLKLSGVGKSGTMTTYNITAGRDSWNRVVFWLKYIPGPAYTVAVDGVTLTMTDRWTLPMRNGRACQETQYEGRISGGQSAVITLTVNTEDEELAAVYEYGVMFF